MKKIIFTIFLIFLFNCNSKIKNKNILNQPEFLKISDSEINEWFNSLTLKDKISQFFVITARNYSDPEVVNNIYNLVKEYKVGGVIYFKGKLNNYIKLNNKIQKISKIPLINTFDGEWGLAMRFPEVYAFPYNMTLGAIRNDTLLFELGKIIGKNCREMKFQIIYAPVVDINSNPLNPVIGMRSYGDDIENVTNKSNALINGIQSQGIIATAKHFPGHGNTSVDSHNSLPFVEKSKEELYKVELIPFESVIKNKIGAIMTAHLQVNSIENSPNTPSSISKNVITDLLINEMQFSGLVITDAMDMKGLTNHYKTGEADLKAFMAGNDLIENSLDPIIGINNILNAVKDGLISEEEIDYRCRKVLKAKKWTMKNQDLIFNDTLKNLDSLNNQNTENFIQKLYDNSITIVGTLFNYDKNTAVIEIKKNSTLSLLDNLKFKKNIFPDAIARKFTPQDFKNIENVYFLISEEVSIYDLNNDLTDKIKEINTIKSFKNKGIISSINPYKLNNIENLNEYNFIILNYQTNKYSLKSIEKVLKNEIKPIGKLPIKLKL